MSEGYSELPRSPDPVERIMRKFPEGMDGNRQVGLWRKVEVSRRGRWSRCRGQLARQLESDMDWWGVQDDWDYFEMMYTRSWYYDYPDDGYSETGDYGSEASLSGNGEWTFDEVIGHENLCVLLVHGYYGLDAALVLPADSREW